MPHWCLWIENGELLCVFSVGGCHTHDSEGCPTAYERHRQKEKDREGGTVENPELKVCEQGTEDGLAAGELFDTADSLHGHRWLRT